MTVVPTNGARQRFAEEQGADYGVKRRNNFKRSRTQKAKGDRSGIGKLGTTARSTTSIGGRRGGKGDSNAGAEAKSYYEHRKPYTTWKGKGGIRSVGDGKDGYPREDGQQNKSNTAVMK